MDKNIRKFIESQGRTMPENLSTTLKSIKELEKEHKSLINNYIVKVIDK